AWMLWRKTIRATGIVSIVLGFVGVVLVLDPTRSALDGMLVVGLASGFFNSCSQLSLYAGGKGGVALSETDNLFQFFTLCAAASLVALLFRPADLTIGVHRMGESAILALFVALSACGVVNQYARSVAYRNVRNPANLGPFLYLSIALSALVDWAAYDIAPSRVALLGGVFIAASSVAVSSRGVHCAVRPGASAGTRARPRRPAPPPDRVTTPSEP